MEVGPFAIALAFLLLVTTNSQDFGQIGTVDSGAQDLIAPRTGIESTVTYNINYLNRPYFAIGLSAF